MEDSAETNATMDSDGEEGRAEETMSAPAPRARPPSQPRPTIISARPPGRPTAKPQGASNESETTSPVARPPPASRPGRPPGRPTSSVVVDDDVSGSPKPPQPKGRPAPPPSRPVSTAKPDADAAAPPAPTRSTVSAEAVTQRKPEGGGAPPVASRPVPPAAGKPSKPGPPAARPPPPRPKSTVVVDEATAAAPPGRPSPAAGKPPPPKPSAAPSKPAAPPGKPSAPPSKPSAPPSKPSAPPGKPAAPPTASRPPPPRQSSIDSMSSPVARPPPPAASKPPKPRPAEPSSDRVVTGEERTEEVSAPATTAKPPKPIAPLPQRATPETSRDRVVPGEETPQMETPATAPKPSKPKPPKPGAPPPMKKAETVEEDDVRHVTGQESSRMQSPAGAAADDEEPVREPAHDNDTISDADIEMKVALIPGAEPEPEPEPEPELEPEPEPQPAALESPQPERTSSMSKPSPGRPPAVRPSAGPSKPAGGARPPPPKTGPSKPAAPSAGPRKTPASTAKGPAARSAAGRRQSVEPEPAPALPPRPGPGHPLFRYSVNEPHGICVYPYEAAHPDDLAMSKEDVIVLLERIDDNWLKGRNVDFEGIFPQRHIRIVRKLACDVQMATGPSCVGMFDFVGESEDELSFEKGELIELIAREGTDWYKGKIGDRVGVFPKDFVEVVEDLPEGEDSLPAGEDSPPAYDDLEQPETKSYDKPCCRATFDFDAADDAELSFKKGDFINILERTDAEWLRGELNGQEGLFPDSFVEVLKDLAIGEKVELSDSSAATAAPAKKDDPAKAEPPPAAAAAASKDDGGRKDPYCVALFDYTGEAGDELSFKEGEEIFLLRRIDDVWMEGVYVNKTGIFPLDFVEIKIDLPKVEEAVKLSKNISAESDLSPRVEALFDFEAENEDELTFKAGDTIYLLDREGGDWYMGELQGKIGKFPTNFVKVIVDLP